MIAAAIPDTTLLYRRTIHILAVLATCGVVVYLALLVAAVDTAVHRAELDRELQIARTEIPALESAYVERLGTIDSAYAHSLGYRDVRRPVYVSASEQDRALSLRAQ